MIAIEGPPRPYWQGANMTVYHGNACDVLPHLTGIDGVVTDPPWYLSEYPEGIQAGASSIVHDDELAWMGKLWLFYASWMTRIQRAGATWGWYFIGVDHAPMFLRIARNIEWTVQHAWPCQGKEWLFYTGPLPLAPPIVADIGASVTLYGPTGTRPYMQLVQLLGSVSGVPRQRVLDPFCGSGSTLQAAQMLGIEAVGIDATERWCQHTQAVLTQVENVVATSAPAPRRMVKRNPITDKGMYQ